MQNPQKTSALGGSKVSEWRYLGNSALAALIVTPARALEITTKLYPEEEMRQAGAICTDKLNANEIEARESAR